MSAVQYKKIVDYKKLSFDPMAYAKSDMPKSAERAEVRTMACVLPDVSA